MPRHFMSSNPVMVDVVMPAYNAENTIVESINSVVNQTWPHWNLLLVVDSQSKDQTRAIAEDFAAREQRIRLITDLPQGGCVYNRNQAIAQATADFLAFLDSDDLWLPEKLARQVAFMQSTGCDLSYTGYAQMDWHGRRLPQAVTPPPKLTHRDLLNNNLLGCLTAMIRRSRFPKIEFVDFLHEDFILWLRLLRETTAQGLPEILAVYRMAPHSRSGNKWNAAYARWRILRDFEHLPLHRALPCFTRYAISALRKRSTKTEAAPA